MKKDKPTQKVTIGAAVRHRRKQLGFTLKELADAAGLSVGFISQIERNLTAPSLSSLASIAQALNVDSSYFIEVPKPSELVHRKNGRLFFSLEDSPVQYCRLNKDLPGSQLSTVLVKSPPGFVSERISHEGEEQIYLLEGEGYVILNDERFAMEAGDCIHYLSETPHQFGSSDDSNASFCLWELRCCFLRWRRKKRQNRVRWYPRNLFSPIQFQSVVCSIFGKVQ